MNWKLIFTLSSLGVITGIAGLFGLTRGIEGVIWLVLMILSTGWITIKTRENAFLHGFTVGCLGGASAPLIYVIFFTVYAANNPETLEQLGLIQESFSPRHFLLLVTPLFGLVTGALLGILSLVAGKVVND